jgi:DNA methylase
LKPKLEEIRLSEIDFDEVIYPRKSHDPALVQKYVSVLDEIEAKQRFISVAADNKLLDGKHRWLAYRKKHENNGDPTIKVFRYKVATPHEQLKLAAELNSEHGWQLTEEDKKSTAISLRGFGCTYEDIAATLSVGKPKVTDWLSDIVKAEKKKQEEEIAALWLACQTVDEIADRLDIPRTTVGSKIEVCPDWFLKTNRDKPLFSEENYQPPLYNVWTFGKKTNNVEHFGNSEQRIIDNLLYLYTEPFDIVLDPFAGGGSTIDVCKRRMRRYWVSDRKPIVERENEIRKLDIAAELPPLKNRWSDVSLTYLDPPYWKQAEGKYSDDAEDLANMPLDQFTETLIGVIKRIVAKQSKGVIALLIQPTQWNAEERKFTDHVMDVVAGVGNKKVILENRVSCPYSTEQYNAQMVEWAKANKKLLVLSRELIIWRIAK